MERSLVRLVAVACVVAGVMLMGGTGAVAAAKPGHSGNGSSSSGDGTAPSGDGTVAPTTDTGANDTNGTDTKLRGADKKPSVGPVSTPSMSLPPQLLTTSSSSSSNGANGLLTVPSPSGSPGIPVTVSAFDLPGRAPARQLTSNPTTAPDNSQAGEEGDVLSQGQDVSPAPSTPEPPTISLLPLVPPGVPTGPPIPITNPVRELLPLELDQPLVPQLLPAPLVAVDFVVPPFLADVISNAQLADIAATATPRRSATSARSAPTATHQTILWMPPAPRVLPNNNPPPADLAPMGMDVSESPQHGIVPVDQPQQPDNPRNNDVALMSDPVAFRAGYSEYLRNAGMAQITTIAVPGAAAILLFAAGGGFIGYRQARAGHVIRAEGITRFLR